MVRNACKRAEVSRLARARRALTRRFDELFEVHAQEQRSERGYCIVMEAFRSMSRALSLTPLFLAIVFSCATQARAANPSPSPSPSPSASPSASPSPTPGPAVRQHELACHRPGGAGGRVAAVAGIGAEPEALLPWRGGRRRLEDRERRSDVGSGLRQTARRGDRRPRDRSDRRRRSFGRAPASRTRATTSAMATASIRRPTAATPGRNVGLKGTKYISRILVDPRNHNHVIVGGARRRLRATARSAASTLPTTAARPGSKRSTSVPKAARRISR